MADPRIFLPQRLAAQAVFLVITAFTAITAPGTAFAVDLPSALQAAQSADPSVASARSNRDAAAENIPISRARLLPQLSLQSTVQHLKQTTEQAGAERDFSGQTRNTTLQLRQALYRPRDRLGAEVGELQAQYGEYQLALAQSEVSGRVVAIWVDVLAAQAQRDFYARSQESAGKAAEQEQRRLRGGEGTRDALAEANAVLAQAKAQLLDAELDVKAKEQAFKLMTRLDPASLHSLRLPNATQLALPLPTAQALWQKVLDSNAEVQAARIAEAVTRTRLDQASADHRPTLDMVGSMARAQNDGTNNLGSKYHNHQIGLQFVLPIYSGGSINASQRQAAAQYAAATTDRQAIEQKLQTQLTLDWHTQEGLRQRAAAAQELLASAREQRRAAERGIGVGLRTWADASAADQLIARRGADLSAMLAGVVKTQARLLALLPHTDPAWDEWARAASALSQP